MIAAHPLGRAWFEHFPAKWRAIRRRKFDKIKESGAHPDSL